MSHPKRATRSDDNEEMLLARENETMRDRAAGYALVGYLISIRGEPIGVEYAAKTAYALADAMLAERDKRGTVDTRGGVGATGAG